MCRIKKTNYETNCKYRKRKWKSNSHTSRRMRRVCTSCRGNCCSCCRRGAKAST
uniref:Uncharacterized protein n=1 Tax=uncultured marine virus TaxID=186617 RepID=A0A0F7L4G0_9VIRU|nr:hypothetical protein [uncultured marine virus]